MPTIEIVQKLKALVALNPTSNAGRMRLRAQAQERIETELRRRADAAREYVERLARGRRL